MAQKNAFKKWQTYIIPSGLILYFVSVLSYVHSKSPNDDVFIGLIVSVLIPFILSILLSLYLSLRSGVDLDERVDEIKNDILDLSILVNRNSIICHGSKHQVPDGERFWNQLLTTSKNRFILIGRSNKSWISKDEGQKDLLSQEIIRIVEKGGEIKMFSDNNSSHVDMTYIFFEKYVFPKIASRKKQVAKKIIQLFKRKVLYCTGEINYSAVISDERLLILPLLHSQEFREKTMVLEINKLRNSTEYSDYNSDIDRTFHGKCNLLEAKFQEFEKKINGE